MKIRININEIGLEKSSKPLNEIIGIVGKPYTAARSAARLRRLKRIYDGPIEPARVDDFLAFTKGKKVRPRPGPAIENIMKRVSDSKREEILRALQDTAETGSSHVVKVGENPDLFIATARTEEGPRIVGRAIGDGGDVKLASEIDSTFGSARFIENPIAINDLPSATLVSRGGPLDVDDYDILSTRFEQLKSDGVLSDVDYDDLVRRIEVRRDAPRRTLSVAEVADLDNVDDLEEFRNTIDQRLEAGVYTIDDVEEVRRAIDDKIPELNLSAAEAEAFLTAQKARDQLADAGVEVDKIAQLQTPEEVGEAINALNLVRDDLPPDEVANLEALLNSRRSQIEDLARARADAAEAGDDAARAGDDAVEAGDDVTPSDGGAPVVRNYTEETIDDWPARRYESQADAKAAADAIKETDVGYALLGEMKKIGKEFRYLPENAPVFKDGNTDKVYIVTDNGNMEAITVTEAITDVKELKASHSQLKSGFGVPLGRFKTYFDEISDFAIPIPYAHKASGKFGVGLRVLEGFINIFLAPGNTIFSPAIATAMRRYGVSKSKIFWTKKALFQGYMALTILSLAGAIIAKYDELKQKRKAIGEDTESDWAIAKLYAEALGLVAKNETLGEYLNLLDEDAVDRAVKNGEVAQEQIDILRKIKSEKGAVFQAAEDVKGIYDGVPGGFAKYFIAAPLAVTWDYWVSSDMFVDRKYGAPEAKKDIKTARAKKDKITAASKDAKEKMDELQDEFGSTDKIKWPGASEEASPSDPKHASRKAVVNDYFTVFKDFEWSEMNDAEKVGHEKLIDMYIDWAETIGDTALLGKAGRLKKEIPVAVVKKEIPVAVGQSVRPEGTKTKKESIIALPTLGKLRIRIKK
jgi:hypothetical protein